MLFLEEKYFKDHISACFTLCFHLKDNLTLNFIINKIIKFSNSGYLKSNERQLAEDAHLKFKQATVCLFSVF